MVGEAAFHGVFARPALPVILQATTRLRYATKKPLLLSFP
jgi:hypothetical protein